jgi:ribosome modulation factor
MPGKDSEKPSDRVATKAKGGTGKSQTVKRALSEIPDSEIKHYAELLISAQSDLEQTMKAAAGERGVISGMLKSAEKVGIAKKFLLEFTKTMKREPEEVRQELEFVDRAARIMGRERFIHQMDLFRDLHASPVKRPQDEGYRVGKSGGSASENPYQPGTEENQQWSSGWNEGQAEIVGTMKPKKPAGDPTAEEAIAAGKAAANAGVKITECPYGKGVAKANWQSGWRLGHTDRAQQGGGPDDGEDDDAPALLRTEADGAVEATAH